MKVKITAMVLLSLLSGAVLLSSAWAAAGQNQGTTPLLNVEPAQVKLVDDATLTLLKTNWLDAEPLPPIKEHKPGISMLFYGFIAILITGTLILFLLFGTGLFKRFSLNMKLYTSFGCLICLAISLGIGGYLYLDRMNSAAHLEGAFMELDVMSNRMEAIQNSFLLHGISNAEYGRELEEKIQHMITEFNNDFATLRQSPHIEGHQLQGLDELEKEVTAYSKDMKIMVDAYHRIEKDKVILEGIGHDVDMALEKMIHHHEAEAIAMETDPRVTSEERQAHTRLLAYLTEAEIYALKLFREEVEFLLDQKVTRVQTMSKNMGYLKAYLKALETMLTIPKEHEMLLKVEDKVATYEKLLTEIIQSEAQVKKTTAHAAHLLHLIAAQSEGMSHTAKAIADALESEGDKSLVSLVLIALVSGCFFSFFIARGISRPIHQIIQGLNLGADQVSSAADQVSASSQSLAEKAADQAASIEETSSSMEEMSAMTRRNTDNAGQADELMKDAAKVVETTNSAMLELTNAMEAISKASDETSKIIKTIDEIAFQTNLLALNAAVEAARAGEAGAGFAVVADEVRNLAMRAADAAKDTANLIQETIKKVTDGTQLAAVTNDAFGQVSESAASAGTLISEISHASGEQAIGYENVNQAISQMDKIIQTNAATAEETAATAEELNAQSEQLNAYVGDLMVVIQGQTARKPKALPPGSPEPQAIEHTAPQKNEAKASHAPVLPPSSPRSSVKTDKNIPPASEYWEDF